MMGDSPVTLEYGKRPRRRRRWGYAIFACLALAAAGASWQYRQPIQRWVNDARADWAFAREFDAVSEELCPDGATWLAPAGMTPGTTEADALLSRMLAVVPGTMNAYRRPSTGVLFVRHGQTNGGRWLAFACVSQSGLEVFSFERDRRTSPGYDRLLETPGSWNNGAAWNVSVTSIEPGDDSGTVEIQLAINGGGNRLAWSMVPAAPGTPTPSQFLRRSDRIANTIVSRTGWASVGQWSGQWWPDTNGVRLLEGAASSLEIPVGEDVAAIGFCEDEQLAAAAASWVRVVDLSTTWIIRTHQLPSPGLRSTDLAVFSPDGQHLFLARTSDSALLVDVSGGQSVPIGRFAGTPRLAFPDNQSLLIGDNVSLRRVRLRDGVAEFLPNSNGVGNSIAAAGTLIARESNRMVNLFDGTNRYLTQFRSLQGLHQLSLSPPAGRWLVMKGQDGLSILDVESGKALWEHEGNFDLHTARSRIKWSADGQIGATAGNQYVYVWSMTEPRWAARFPHGRTGQPPDVAISADGKRLAASGSKSGTIAYWSDLHAAVPDGK